MSELSSAREALLAEAIGELGHLIDRLEAVAPAMDASRAALLQSSQALADQIAAFEARMVDITQNAKLHAVRHVARRTDEMAAQALNAHTQALEEAARAVFRTELGPALQRILAQPRAPAAQGTHRFGRWQSPAATAAVAAILTWAVTWLWAR